MDVTAYIALGSNLGERRETLERALQFLGEYSQIKVGRVSTFYETEPVGGPAGQGKYLNAVAEVRTELTAAGLLQVLLDVESQLGRVRGEKFGPRTIDLDVLLYGSERLEQPELVVPHPRMHERRFVLEPLVEIAPQVWHPVLQKTARALLDELSAPRRELAGLRALVTGSTSGIGLAIAFELARAGADVLVHGRRSPERAREVAEKMQALGVRSQPLLADLREAEACATLVQAAWEAWDGLDVWVNNAGADTLTGTAASWPFARKLAELWAVDVAATMFLARAIGERMRGEGGVILNMGWDQSETGMEGDSGQLFAATKGAVMAFSKSLAVTLAPKVRVNCLAPGWIRTAWGEQASSTWQERVMRETPLKRWGTPEDVAQTARWLASPAASFVTGQIIRINGGAVRG